jgi:hypothetical protein
MNEQVLASIFGRDEAKALVVVEPLHGSFSTHCTILGLETDDVAWQPGHDAGFDPARLATRRLS